MVKRIYYITALMLFLLGVPILNYFAYSNQIGAITITEKSWTDFCNATSWNNPADVPCSANIDFIANEDTYWYPYVYDPYGRQAPASFKPSVKEWKLERKWWNGWREIPMDKACSRTWCGAKKDGSTTLYSVAWRKGKTYETRILAIKNNPEDAIYWQLGDLDPYWFGVNVEKLYNEEIVKSEVWKNITYEYTCPTNRFNFTKKRGYCYENTANPVNGSYNIIFEHDFDRGYLANKTIYWDKWEFKGYENKTINGSITGYKLNNYLINFTICDLNCKRNDKIFSCDVCSSDGNCDGIKQDNEAGIKIDLTGNLKEQIYDFKSNSPKILKELKSCIK